MRNSSLFLAAGLLLSGFGVGAAQAQSTGATDKGYFGDWKANPAKYSVSAGGPPPGKSGTRHHEDLGNGFILMQSKSVNANGENTFQSYVIKADGKQYPNAQQKQTVPSTVTFTLVDPYTTTFQFYNDGKPGNSGTRTTSKDGKTMTLDSKNTNAQGQTYTTHQEFDKQ